SAVTPSSRIARLSRSRVTVKSACRRLLRSIATFRSPWISSACSNTFLESRPAPLGRSRSREQSTAGAIAMKPTRRQFLHQSAAFPASWVAFTAALRAATAAPAAATTAAGHAGEPLWQLVRRQFPLEDGLIYLNAANVCPASHPVLDRYAALLRDFQGNPSFQNRDKYRP